MEHGLDAAGPLASLRGLIESALRGGANAAPARTLIARRLELQSLATDELLLFCESIAQAEMQVEAAADLVLVLGAARGRVRQALASSGSCVARSVAAGARTEDEVLALVQAPASHDETPPALLDDAALRSALISALDGEPDALKRDTLLSTLAWNVRRRPAEPVGAELVERLRAALRRPDSAVREAAIAALARCPDRATAEALLEHLWTEAEPVLRRAVLRHPHLRLGATAADVLEGTASRDEDALVRAEAIRAHAELDAPYTTELYAMALHDPDDRPRAAAARALAAHGTRAQLGELAKFMPHPMNRAIYRELEQAIRAITQREAPRPLAEARPIVERDIAIPAPDRLGFGALGKLQEQHHAMSLCGSLIYLWGLSRDGEVLCMDHEAFARPVETEDRAGVRFAALLLATVRHPELAAFVPACPPASKACSTCRGDGCESKPDGSHEVCMGCSGLGWYG